PALKLDEREIADLELIATGAASPLKGYLGSADYHSVLERMRLTDGTVWPIPFTLAVEAQDAKGLVPGRLAALRDERGRLWGSIAIVQWFARDPRTGARAISRPDAPFPRGVASLFPSPKLLPAGPIRALPLPDDPPFANRRLSPSEMRREISARGWQRVGGFQ